MICRTDPFPGSSCFEAVYWSPHTVGEIARMLVDTAAGRPAGLSDEEKTAIQEQLGRLLADSHFSQSRRFPSFLRYVVEKTLAGQDDALKERTLGVEIFGRRPTMTPPPTRLFA